MKLGRYLTLVLQKVGTVRQFVSEGKGDFASCASRNWEFANYDRTGKESSFDQELGRGWGGVTRLVRRPSISRKLEIDKRKK